MAKASRSKKLRDGFVGGAVFRVQILPRAFNDLDTISAYIKAEGSFTVAERWLQRIVERIGTLAKNPNRCPIAFANESLQQPIRLLLSGSRQHAYKIYFSMSEAHGTVHVVHVRHWARKAPTAAEIKGSVTEPQ